MRKGSPSPVTCGVKERSHIAILCHTGSLYAGVFLGISLIHPPIFSSSDPQRVCPPRRDGALLLLWRADTHERRGGRRQGRVARAVGGLRNVSRPCIHVFPSLWAVTESGLPRLTPPPLPFSPAAVELKVRRGGGRDISSTMYRGPRVINPHIHTVATRIMCTRFEHSFLSGREFPLIHPSHFQHLPG